MISDGLNQHGLEARDLYLEELVSLANCDECDELFPESFNDIDPALFDTGGIEFPAPLFDRGIRHARLSGGRVPTEGSASAQVAFEWLAADSNEGGGRHARKSDLQSLVVEGFRLTRSMYPEHANVSTDRLIVDPQLSASFIQHCWQLGAESSPTDLMWTLMNARKAGKLTGIIPPADRFSIPRNRLDCFAFASEFALRSIQDHYYYEAQRDLSLDKILCDPVLATEFDSTARKLAPGYSSVEYRWAAMALRKSHRYQQVENVFRRFTALGRLDALRTNRISSCPGLYAFASGGESIYFGVTENLRQQVDRHLELGGLELVPEWVLGRKFIGIEIAVLEVENLSPSKRDQLRSHWVVSTRPQLNYVGLIGSLSAAATSEKLLKVG